MFPNPQDALPHPPHPNAEYYRKLAKDLVKACKSGDSGAFHNWVSAFVHDHVERSGIELAPGIPRWIEQVSHFAISTLQNGERTCALADAQFVIARSLGFTSWPKLTRHFEEIARDTSAVTQFEAAAEAIVSGDIATLRTLLQANPSLIRHHSTREHRATLLHYTAANGVENYRQKTPANIVDITRLLLASGAEVDAEADMYRGKCTALGLAATSTHPETAGVQFGLLQLLLDHGAQIEKPNLAGNNHGAVLACLANGHMPAAAFLASRGASLDLETAAGVGRLDVVKACFLPDGTLASSSTQQQLQKGFIWACVGGYEDVALFLLDHGAELRDSAGKGATGMHWAAGAGQAGLIRKLIQLGSPLEDVNRWGGTVLEHAGHGLEHDTSNIDFLPTFEALLAAGAKIRPHWLAWIDGLKGRPAAEKSRLAEVFRRYGATT